MTGQLSIYRTPDLRSSTPPFQAVHGLCSGLARLVTTSARIPGARPEIRPSPLPLGISDRMQADIGLPPAALERLQRHPTYYL